ncbi:MAG: 2-C-methyl-D-erythritol 2,4-cyclodiphosphate synthase, partial [Betaproteobacteria bacterium]|nr:2-C-methyl-D-erythritol 2,4-cyclodiphosphate synthase [Betaproteobacteria bacterium]
GIDSRELLRQTAAKVAAAGFRIVNVDATIIAEAPRMAPHVWRMVGNIAADLGLQPAAVNVKATSTEELGFIGREEGIAAQAVALIEQRS